MATNKKALKRPAAEQEVRIEKKARFFKALAQFLAGDQGKKSILLDPRMSASPAYSLAREWADLRNASPLRGYGTVEEAEKELTAWLS